MFAMATRSASELPVPAWKRTRQPTPRPQLSREVIIDTAMKLLDADGLDGVSMRRVAEELGTGPASLYAHVANKEELLELLLERVVREITVPEPDPARWQEQLFEVGRQSHRVYTSHRDIAAVSLAVVPTGSESLRIAEGMFAIMLAGGVPPKVAGWALDRLALYIAADAYEGSLLAKVQAASGKPFDEFVEEYFSGIREFYENLPPERFPNITAHVPELMGGDGEDRFDFGLEMLIRSLATYVPADFRPETA